MLITFFSLNRDGWTLQSSADANGADWNWGLPSGQEALDRGILRFWGVVTPVLRLWVGHKGSPLHTALVERHKFLVLGGLPQQTVFWNQNLTHRNQQVKGGWLLLVCHFLDALQTFENLLCLHLQGLCVQTFTAKMALPFWLKSFCSRK